MKRAEKDAQWVHCGDIDGRALSEGVEQKVLAYCDKLMCVQNTFQAGAVGALHSHPHTQITYVVEGKFEFTIGDTTRVVVKGDSMLKQDGVVHGCTCLEDGALLDIFHPMREDFVE